MITGIFRIALDSVPELKHRVGMIVLGAGNQSQTEMSFGWSRVHVRRLGQVAGGLWVTIEVVKCYPQIVKHLKVARAQFVHTTKKFGGAVVLLILCQDRGQ